MAFSSLLFPPAGDCLVSWNNSSDGGNSFRWIMGWDIKLMTSYTTSRTVTCCIVVVGGGRRRGMWTKRHKNGDETPRSRHAELAAVSRKWPWSTRRYAASKLRLDDSRSTNVFATPDRHVIFIEEACSKRYFVRYCVSHIRQHYWCQKWSVATYESKTKKFQVKTPNSKRSFKFCFFSEWKIIQKRARKINKENMWIMSLKTQQASWNKAVHLHTNL